MSIVRASLCLMLLCWLTSSSAWGQFVSQTFDEEEQGSPYTAGICFSGSQPEVLEGGPTGVGRFLRLGFETPSQTTTRCA